MFIKYNQELVDSLCIYYTRLDGISTIPLDYVEHFKMEREMVVFHGELTCHM